MTIYIISIIFILLILMDLYRIFNFIKFCFNFIYKNNNYIQYKKIIDQIFQLKKNNKKIKINNISYFNINIKKIFKYLNIKIIIPIIFCLLFADSFSLTTSESTNNIHHFVLDEKGELLEVTNDEEKMKIEKERILKEIEKRRQEKEDEKLWALFFIVLLFFGYSIFLLIYLYFHPDDDDDDENSAEEKRKDFERDPQSEPYYTPYLKRWKGQETRLHNKTNPFYTGTCTGKKYEHFSPEYVDKYNEYIREWEDANIYCKHYPQARRYWEKIKKDK